MTQPNVLFLMTDQQRWDAMSCSGTWVNTPNLDRIAREGVRFANCVTTTPICVPARVTLATGLYCHNTHVWTNLPFTLPPNTQSWMRVLKDMGYRTSLFGKTHLHPHRGDLREKEELLNQWGLDDVDEIGGPRASASVMSHMTAMWEGKGLLQAYRDDFAERFRVKPHMVRPSSLPLEDYADVYVGQQAKNYLKVYDRNQPWFCWVTFGGPHEPWDAPEPYASMYDPNVMPLPTKPYASPHQQARGWLDAYRERNSPDFDTGDVAAMRANYAGNVTLIDDQIGEILDVIEARGELDNTVIGFTSDHGEMNGDQGLVYKMNFIDASVRVPLLFRTPETAATSKSAVYDEAVENVDLGPTLVELAGGEIEYDQFGKSLASVVHGSGTAPRDGVLSEFSNEIMFFDGEWKIVLNRRGQTYLLFHHAADPAEQINLAGNPDYADIERDLRSRLMAKVAESQLRGPWH